MTDMREKIAGIVRQAIYDHEAYIDSPETIAASAIMALQQARIDKLEAKLKTVTKKWAEASGLSYDLRAELKQARAALKEDQ